MYIAKGNGILFASEDKDFGEKYTRSSFKFKYGGYYNSLIAKRHWDYYFNGQMYPYKDFQTGKELSLEDSIKSVHCQNCDKILMNNAFRYCDCKYKVLK